MIEGNLTSFMNEGARITRLFRLQHYGCYGGCPLAACVVMLSLSPSLLPYSSLLQAMVSASLDGVAFTYLRDLLKDLLKGPWANHIHQ